MANSQRTLKYSLLCAILFNKQTKDVNNMGNINPRVDLAFKKIFGVEENYDDPYKLDQ